MILFLFVMQLIRLLHVLQKWLAKTVRGLWNDNGSTIQATFTLPIFLLSYKGFLYPVNMFCINQENGKLSTVTSL